MKLKKRPVETKDNEFTITYVVRRCNSGAKSCHFSPYHSFSGFQWRVVVEPFGNSIEVKAKIECGGPCVESAATTSGKSNIATAGVGVSAGAGAGAPSTAANSAATASAPPSATRTGTTKASTDRNVPSDRTTSASDDTDSWKCRVRYNFSVVHPLRWSELGLDIAASGSCAGSNEDEPDGERSYIPSDVQATDVYDFSNDGTIAEIDEFVPIALLQPGMYANSEYDFVVRCTLIINDSWIPCHAPSPSPLLQPPPATPIAHRAAGSEENRTNVSSSFLKMFDTVTGTYRQTSIRRFAR